MRFEGFMHAGSTRFFRTSTGSPTTSKYTAEVNVSFFFKCSFYMRVAIFHNG